MLNIKYSKKAFLSVDNFIIYLKNYYKRIYFDTGIVWEELIVLNYIQKTEKLFDEIIDKIEDTLYKWVYWVIVESNVEFELSKLVIWVRSYNIVVIIKKTKDIIIIDDIIF